jgi:hypothetical protein
MPVINGLLSPSFTSYFRIENNCKMECMTAKQSMKSSPTFQDVFRRTNNRSEGSCTTPSLCLQFAFQVLWKRQWKLCYTWNWSQKVEKTSKVSIRFTGKTNLYVYRWNSEKNHGSVTFLYQTRFHIPMEILYWVNYSLDSSCRYWLEGVTGNFLRVHDNRGLLC